MEFKYYLLGFLSAFLVVVVAVGGFYLGKGNQKKVLSSEVSFSVSPTPIIIQSSPTPTPRSNREIVAEIIIDALESKDYGLLESYLTDSVSFKIVATECCQPRTPEEVVEQLKYLNSAIPPWDFTGKADFIADITATYPEDYANAIIAVAQNRFVAAFQLDNDFKISKITLASDYNLLAK